MAKKEIVKEQEKNLGKAIFGEGYKHPADFKEEKMHNFVEYNDKKNK